MSYRVGFCPQCQTQIMVQDSNGNWNSRKPTFRQAYISWGDSLSRVKTAICVNCLKNPNLDTIIDSITHTESQAPSKQIIDYILSRGKPTSIEGGI